MKKRFIIVKCRNSGNHFVDVNKMVCDRMDEYEMYVTKHGKHFTDKLAEYASSMMKNANGTTHTWTVEQVGNVVGKESVNEATMGDLTYLANMAYADFYPSVLKDTESCINFAIASAVDKDGYEGMAFMRWLIDMKEKGIQIKWSEFM